MMKPVTFINNIYKMGSFNIINPGQDKLDRMGILLICSTSWQKSLHKQTPEKLACVTKFEYLLLSNPKIRN